MELADVLDSKSSGSDTVRVRPPPPAPDNSMGTQILGAHHKNPNLFIWSTVVLSISPEKGSDLLLLSGNQRLQTAVIVFPFGAYFGVIFVF